MLRIYKVYKQQGCLTDIHSEPPTQALTMGMQDKKKSYCLMLEELLPGLAEFSHQLQWGLD